MDDLLALMESDDAEVPTNEQSGQRQRVNNDNGNRSRHANESIQPTTRRSSSASQDAGNRPITENNSTTSKCQAAEVGVDDQVGIRMLKRRVSSSELTDLLSIYSYHSTASLSAMSLAALNRLLSEPATIVDSVTVGGSMEIITLGIVFTNSGTRIASTGSAFCTLSIGNLNTGPCATVLLFGEAYSSACRSCLPGRVIALLMPRLVPPKDKHGGPSSTPITFSINSKDQLIVVADARDYGTCRATVTCRGGFRMPNQNESQAEAGGAKPCKNFIDKRISEYCTVHRKLAFVKNNSSNSNMNKSGVSSKGLTPMQRLRQEHQGHRMQAPSGSSNGLQKTTPTSSHLSSSNGDMNKSNMAFCQSQPIVRSAQAPSNNSILNASLNRNPVPTNRNPVPTTDRGHGNIHIRTNNQGLTSSIGKGGGSNFSIQRTVTPQQPLPAPKHMTKQVSALHKSNELTSDTTNVNCGVVDTNWLKKGTKHRAPLVPVGSAVEKKRRTSVNTDKAGYDGSVPVPKPNKLFGGKRSFLQGYPPTSSAHISLSNMPVSREAAVAAEVKEKQREIASMLQESEIATKTTKANQPAGLKRKGNVAGSQASESIFQPELDLDVDKLMSAKSRFADEIDAEEYVKSRRIVSELEQKEEAKLKKDKSKPTIDPAIVKEYFCPTCDRTFRVRPTACVRNGHKVTLHRSVKATESIEQKRTEISNKAVEDGGLRLGTGLEWSGPHWSRPSG